MSRHKSMTRSMVSAAAASDISGVVITALDQQRDLAGVLEIAAASFPRPWTRDMFVEALERAPGTRAFVARSANGLVVAYCVGQMVLDELHVHVVAVGSQWRQRGLGASLLAFFLHAAGQENAVTATLEVRQSNVAARRLYEGAGFVRSGVRPGYYADPVEDALVYWRRRLAGGASERSDDTLGEAPSS
ncbi:MAG: ribosomal protein S18-alanine N-acetyltransferase [Vicinamibacterales bacterium]|jgi:ribosomal-protein-alanine N-acetyltransferase|nr:ribosomal protein S18-alanine N-acetyltransferase [Vicinamibacterales bacterium]